ncbi:pilus modification protein PilQ, partial [Arthrobacter stackebrandtii]
VRQVAIEARIVEANVDYEKSLGVRWGGPLYGESLRPGKELFVDLGVERAGSSVGLGLLRGDVLLDLELSAMEKSGNGEIISQPKVVTADKETARILKGTEVPYQETSQSGATSVAFREASLSLEVTPQITPDNKVIMAVRVTKDEPDYVNAVNNVPPIRKNEVNAKVRVADGETIVIGGVYSTSQNNVVDKVPFFGDLPYVGRLFRRDVLQEKKSELLVFLTPRIMSDQAIAVSR